jgi:hypothetical protein
MSVNINVPRYHFRQSEIDQTQNEINVTNNNIHNLNNTLSYSSYKDNIIKQDIADNNTTINKLNDETNRLEYDRDTLIEIENLKQHELEMLREGYTTSSTYISAATDKNFIDESETANNIVIGQIAKQNFFDNINMQNNNIQKKNSLITNDYVTSAQKEYYETSQQNTINNINFWFFIFYYFFLLIFIFILFFIQRTMTLFNKIIIILAFGLYPFCIIFVENVILKLLYFCLEFIQTKIPS